jgi:hypothetical protein
MSTPEQRKAYKKYWKEEDKIYKELGMRWYGDSYPDTHPFPDEFRGMTCSAKTRAGTPCKRIDLEANGRCKLHGGLSTGPRTIEGKKRSALNGKLRKKSKKGSVINEK